VKKPYKKTETLHYFTKLIFSERRISKLHTIISAVDFPFEHIYAFDYFLFNRQKTGKLDCLKKSCRIKSGQLGSPF
jgi:hypothetical protein